MLLCSLWPIRSRYPAGMASCSYALMLSHPRCHYALALSCSHGLMPACSQSPPVTYVQRDAPSLSRFPFLDSTGFENRAPVEAGSSFLENKGFLSRGRPQELPKSSQDPSKSPPRGPKSCQRGSKRTPQTLQDHQKKSHSLIA